MMWKWLVQQKLTSIQAKGLQAIQKTEIKDIKLTANFLTFQTFCRPPLCLADLTMIKYLARVKM